MVWDSLNETQKTELEKLQKDVNIKLKELLTKIASGEEVEDLKYLGVTITKEEAERQLSFFPKE